MKKLFLIVCTLTVSTVGYGQSHYIVEYDRINDGVSYYQVKLDHGSLVEIPVKKLRVKEGDILQGRMRNVNTLAIDPDIAIQSQWFDSPPGTLEIVSNLISNLPYPGASKGILGALSAIFEVSQTGYGGPLRGDADDRSAEAKILGIMDEIRNNAEDFNAFYSEFDALDETVFSISSTKEEILNQISSMETALSNMNESNTYSNLSEEFNLLSTLIDDAEFLDDDLQSQADELLQAWEAIQLSGFDPYSAENILAEAKDVIMASNFEYTEKIIIDGSLDDNEKLVIDFRFNKLMDSDNYEEFDFDSNDDLFHYKVIEVPFERNTSPLGFSNGILTSIPLKADMGLSILESSDSVMFKSVDIPAQPNVSVSAMLRYEFTSTKNFAPSFNLGLAIPINALDGTNEIEDAIKLVTSLGFRFYRMPKLNFQVGLSWKNNQSLNTELRTNQVYSWEELAADGFAEDYYWDDPDYSWYYLTDKVYSANWRPELVFGVSLDL
jgi:hypothetical protein